MMQSDQPAQSVDDPIERYRRDILDRELKAAEEARKIEKDKRDYETQKERAEIERCFKHPTYNDYLKYKPYDKRPYSGFFMYNYCSDIWTMFKDKPHIYDYIPPK